MSYRVYISPACRADAERHAQSNEIESFAVKLERDQSTRQLARFPPYLKKTFGKPGRLLIEEVQLDVDGDTVTVLCFSRYLIRGDHAYDGFLDNTEQFQRQNPIDLDDVRRRLAETAEPDTPPAPEPSAAESSCLHALNPINLGEVALLESSKLQTRRWSKPGEDGDRFSTEILVVPGHKVQFLDKPNGANGNGARAAAETAPANGEVMPAGGAPAQTDQMDDDLPF